MMGMLDKPGMPARLDWMLRLYRPPITTVSPSLTNMSVLASRVVIVGMPLTCWVKSASFFVAVIFIPMNSLGVTCGVTFKTILASTNSVFVPSADTVATGIFRPLWICASVLSSVAILGLEMILPRPDDSNAESWASRMAPPMLASENPIAPPWPSATAAGKSNKKFAGAVGGESPPVFPVVRSAACTTRSSVVRMAVEDAYGAEERREAENGDEVAFRTERVHRSVCRAVAEYSFRTAARTHARVYGGPKWTVSPVYEGMLKEELDAAAERYRGRAVRAAADRRHLRRAGGRRCLGRAARDPGAEPRRRLPVGAGAGAVRLDRRRRVGAAVVRRGAAHDGS